MTEQNGTMTSTTPPIEKRIPALVARIHRAIPGCEVRMFGSRARGSAGPDSDIDLLITAPDEWMQSHHRYQVLGDLSQALSQPDVSLDLLLFSRSECDERRHWLNHVIARAYREGVVIDGAH
jgi:predicted nucleotidyltransferase